MSFFTVDPHAPPTKSKLHPPRQSSSAWQIFFTDHLAEVKSQAGNEKINVANIAKEAGLIYSKMDAETKKPYTIRAEEARKQYQIDYAAWLAALSPEDIKHENLFRAGQRKNGKSRKGNLKDMNAPKKPLSAYFLFLKAIRSDERLSGIVFGKETETTKQSMNAAMRWRSFLDEDKRVSGKDEGSSTKFVLTPLSPSQPFLKQAELDKAEYDTMRRLYEEESDRRAKGQEVAERDYQPSYVRDAPSQELLDAVLAPGDGTGIRLTAEQMADLAALPEAELVEGEMDGHDSEEQDHEDQEHELSPGDGRVAGEGTSPSGVFHPAMHQGATSIEEDSGVFGGHHAPDDGMTGMEQLVEVHHDDDLPVLHTGLSMPGFDIPTYDTQHQQQQLHQNLPQQSVNITQSHRIEESSFLVTGADGQLHGIREIFQQVNDDEPMIETSQIHFVGGGADIGRNALMDGNSAGGGATVTELPDEKDLEDQDGGVDHQAIEDQYTNDHHDDDEQDQAPEPEPVIEELPIEPVSSLSLTVPAEEEQVQSPSVLEGDVAVETKEDVLPEPALEHDTVVAGTGEDAILPEGEQVKESLENASE